MKFFENLKQKFTKSKVDIKVTDLKSSRISIHGWNIPLYNYEGWVYFGLIFFAIGMIISTIILPPLLKFSLKYVSERFWVPRPIRFGIIIYEININFFQNVNRWWNWSPAHQPENSTMNYHFQSHSRYMYSMSQIRRTFKWVGDQFYSNWDRTHFSKRCLRYLSNTRLNERCSRWNCF